MLRPGASEAARRQVPATLAPPQGSSLAPAHGLDLMGRARQLAIAELQAPAARREGCRALLPSPGGQLLAGGSDRAVRCWDSGRPQQSYVVCAPPPPPPAAGAGEAGGEGGAVDVPQYGYATRSVQGVPVLEESCTLQRCSSSADREAHLARQGWAERASALCHQLGVTDLARAEASEPLLLSAGADGCVKAWR